MKQHCNNCVFFVTTAAICRRYPPTKFICVEHHHIDRAVTFEDLPVWPKVGRLDWCGEWSKKPDSDGERE